jgi:large conductance mechanosensitive channel
MLKEFKEFALRGNVLDLAVGVIVGGAFGKIVTSLVNDIIMPPIGLLVGGVDFTNLFVDLSDRNPATLAEAKAQGIATLNYGLFMNTVLDFLIVSFAIFMLVRQINRIVRQAIPAKDPVGRECPYCVSTVSSRATRCPNCTSEIAKLV